jgi:hypothetical protein
MGNWVTPSQLSSCIKLSINTNRCVYRSWRSLESLNRIIVLLWVPLITNWTGTGITSHHEPSLPRHSLRTTCPFTLQKQSPKVPWWTGFKFVEIVRSERCNGCVVNFWRTQRSEWRAWWRRKGQEQGAGAISAHEDKQTLHEGNLNKEKAVKVGLVGWCGPDDLEVWHLSMLKHQRTPKTSQRVESS